jgi:hypothetical protein
MDDLRPSGDRVVGTSTILGPEIVAFSTISEANLHTRGSEIEAVDRVPVKAA